MVRAGTTYVRRYVVRALFSSRRLEACGLSASIIPNLHDTTGCQPVVQPGLTTGLTSVLNEQPLFVQPVVKPGCTTVLTTGCIHDTAVCQTGCQTVECLYTRYNRLSNRFDNGFENRLYRVYKHLPSCQTGLTTGLTTGCIV